MKSKKVKQGNILIAEPYMIDKNFKRSVVVLTYHRNIEGTIGFVINKKITTTLHKLLKDLPAQMDLPVFYGGPLFQDAIFYLHRIGHLLDDSVEITKGLYMGGDFEKLKTLMEHDLITPDDIRFYKGYSSWGPEQLKEELIESSWVVSDHDPNYLFSLSGDEVWTQALKDKGEPYTILAEIPDSASWN